MYITSYEYIYNPKNLELANFNLFNGNFDMNLLIAMGVVLFLGFIYYIVTPYIIQFIILNTEYKIKEAGKNRIRELILMKEIQNELERELDESLLNSGLKTF